MPESFLKWLIVVSSEMLTRRQRQRERESGGVTETAAYCGDTSVLTRTDAYTQTHRDTGREIDRQKDRETEIQTVS